MNHHFIKHPKREIRTNLFTASVIVCLHHIIKKIVSAFYPVKITLLFIAFHDSNFIRIMVFKSFFLFCHVSSFSFFMFLNRKGETNKFPVSDGVRRFFQCFISRLSKSFTFKSIKGCQSEVS